MDFLKEYNIKLSESLLSFQKTRREVLSRLVTPNNLPLYLNVPTFFIISLVLWYSQESTILLYLALVMNLIAILFWGYNRIQSKDLREKEEKFTTHLSLKQNFHRYHKT